MSRLFWKSGNKLLLQRERERETNQLPSLLLLALLWFLTLGFFSFLWSISEPSPLENFLCSFHYNYYKTWRRASSQTVSYQILLISSAVGALLDFMKHCWFQNFLLPFIIRESFQLLSWTSLRALKTIAGARAASSLLMFLSSWVRVEGWGEYTLLLRNPHRKKLSGLRSGERAGQLCPWMNFLETTGVLLEASHFHWKVQH